ncbi:ABC transporter permease [Sulfolobus sp. A20]|uniref:ABC transporter permease n=1 Tax=Sulfolobaceae TaxID=118883 RepID=UPI000845BF58|nr:MULTISPECIES: ABC transporter permease subunit [unclassified Sulfolobus]TRM74917.1 ABC transporter permease [Sulfolobus sp. E5]TRM78740.1 ABC transporter permease [Sulfolobus sp. A20-N-F8]TRM78856.1 ABC transporter permease [Sulfolobus sp. B5]TRM85499.1 ABC transporter permease [Sulfolobus sp. F3]TRM95519.1 ABC transporter permease [Sulfolobus sp. A20-N-G8]TRM99486.1 ABC transporter permease [Sulfolobus sp. F1]TRN01414.1 ABC transporter permease [Sulfolobus sp. E1]
MKYSSPYLVYIIAFGFLPFIYTFIFLGVNFDKAFTGFSLVPFPKIVYNTLYFSLLTAFFSSIIGTFLAVGVDMLSKGKRLISLLVMLPYTIPFTSSALIWTISLYGNYGWFSYLFGLRYDPLYFSSTALIAVTGVSIWSSIPMPFLIMLSTLRSIPNYVKEASKIDNLPLSEYYFRVALPMAGKAFWISFLLEFIIALGNFDLPYVLTSGGPSYSTTTLSLLVYDEMFSLGNFSGGALAAAILSVFATIPSIALLMLLRSKKSGWLSLNIKIPDKIFKVIIFIFLAIVTFFMDFPIYWMFLVAFRSASLDFRYPPIIIPEDLTAKYFMQAILSSIPYMISSIIVAISASLITVLLSLPSAYEISKGKLRWLLPVSIYLYSLPSTSFVIPLYIFFSNTNLLNTWEALIISTPIFTATFAVWLFFNYFLGFPKAYEDAAEVFSIKRKLTRIIMPLSRTTLFSVLLLSFIFNWHLLFYPLIFTQTPYNFSFPPQGAQTITIFALLAIGNESINWGLLASSALVASFPVMILTLIALDRVLRGGYEGGLKFV